MKENAMTSCVVSGAHRASTSSMFQQLYCSVEMHSTIPYYFIDECFMCMTSEVCARRSISHPNWAGDFSWIIRRLRTSYSTLCMSSVSILGRRGCVSLDVVTYRRLVANK